MKSSEKFLDYLPSLVLVLLGFLGLFVFLKLHEIAFPLATINFEVNRDQVKSVALNYITKLGYSTEGYDSSVIFDYDGNAKEFLEKKLPQEVAASYMGRKIPVWYWQVRFFRYFQKEEYKVNVDPSGKVITFERTISDDERAKELSPEEGKEKALGFLREQGIDTNKIELIDQGGKPLTYRTDRTYTFKEKDFDIQGARLYHEVRFQGDRIGYFSTYLYIPQKDKLIWKNEGEKGNLLVKIGNLLTVFLLLGVVLFVHFRKIQFRWRFAVYVAVGIVAVTLLEQINSLTLVKSTYITSRDAGSFWIYVWIGIVFATVMYGLIAFFASSLAVSLQEESSRYEHPILILGGKKIPTNILIGYIAAFAVLGYDVSFYLWGKRLFDVWTPLDIPYDNILSTPLPWVNALFIGFSAAVLEEFIFRMCSITFLRKWSGNTVLALVLPAVLWAMLHCNYPQQPFYIRAVELTFVGIFLGWIYLRFGILSTISCHYCLNAVYGSTLLIKSGNPYFVVSGIFTVFLMLVPAIVVFAIKNKLEQMELKALREEELAIAEELKIANRNEKLGEEIPMGGEEVAIGNIERSQSSKEKEDAETSKAILGSPQLTTLTPPFFSNRMKIVLAILALVGILGAITIKSPKLGEGQKFEIDQYQAVKIGRKFLEDKGVDLSRSAFGVRAEEYPNADESKYISREIGIKNADKHIRKFLPTLMWVVDVNFDGRKESYKILIQQDGKVFTYFHKIPDEEGSGKIPAEEAKRIAVKYIERFPGNFEFKDFRQKGHTNRNDFEFFFREKAGDVAEAKLLASVQVQGSEPQGFKKYFEIPDSFRRKQEEHSLKETLASAFLIILAGIISVWSIVYSIKRKLEGQVDLRFGFYCAIPITIASLIACLNEAGSIWINLSFDEPFYRAITNWAIQTILLCFTIGMFSLYVSCILESLYRQVFPDAISIPAWISSTWKEGLHSAHFHWGLICSYTLTLLLSFPLTPVLLDEKRVTFLRNYKLWVDFPNGIPFIPVVDVICRAVVEGFLFLSIFAVILLFLKNLLKKNLPVIIAVISCILASSLIMVEGNDFVLNLLGFLFSLTSVSVVLLFLKFFFRDNIYAYIFLPVALIFWGEAIPLIRAGASFYVINGVVLLLILIVPLILCFVSKRAFCPFYRKVHEKYIKDLKKE